MEQDIVSLTSSGDVLFMMLGAVMVFAMHGGFAFLEVGTVRKKNQVNALVKILVDFSVSTLAYFLIGYAIAYGMYFFQPAKTLIGENQGYELVHFFFLLTFAAAVPAIISGGIAERAKFWTQALAAAIFVDRSIYCFKRGIDKYSYLSEKFEFPGGKMEIGENDEDALKRELAEEIGVEVYVDEKIITVIGGYLILPLFISIPYYLSIYNISFINAYFEAVSGFTSTGFSIFSNIRSNIS